MRQSIKSTTQLPYQEEQILRKFFDFAWLGYFIALLLDFIDRKSLVDDDDGI